LIGSNNQTNNPNIQGFDTNLDRALNNVNKPENLIKGIV